MQKRQTNQKKQKRTGRSAREDARRLKYIYEKKRLTVRTPIFLVVVLVTTTRGGGVSTFFSVMPAEASLNLHPPSLASKFKQGRKIVIPRISEKRINPGCPPDGFTIFGPRHEDLGSLYVISIF